MWPPHTAASGNKEHHVGTGVGVCAGGGGRDGWGAEVKGIQQRIWGGGEGGGGDGGVQEGMEGGRGWKKGWRDGKGGWMEEGMTEIQGCGGRRDGEVDVGMERRLGGVGGTQVGMGG